MSNRRFLTYAFNGDADGLCALQQLRLVDPRAAKLVTGVKRDIELLQRVDAGAGDQVMVLDVSLDQNRGDLSDSWRPERRFAISITTTRARCRSTPTSRRISRKRPTSAPVRW